MRIKLVYPAQPFLQTEVPRPDGSLGLLYIAGALRTAGFEISLLDMCVGDEEDSLDEAFFRREPIDGEMVRVGISPQELSRKLRGFDVVAATSIFTMNSHQAFEVARVAKQLDPPPLTVAGGGNARALHRRFLDSGFDVVVFGEGEETIVDLCRAWEQERDLSGVPGIAFKAADGGVVVTPERSVEFDLDRLPLPAWDLLPREKYWQLGDPPGGAYEAGRKVRYLSMQTSRGCPFRCTYCHISRENDAAKVRLKSDGRVLDELETIQSLGAEHVTFQDDSLLADRDRVVRLLGKLSATGLDFSNFNGLNVRHFFRGSDPPLRLDHEMLEAIREAGIGHFSLGLESGSRRILSKYSTKKWDPAIHDIVALIRATVRAGITVDGYFTIGYPDETLQELDETFMLARRLVDEGLDYASFYVVTPYPGSALYDLAAKKGHLPADLDLGKMKFQIPSLVNTTVPREVISYSRELAYKLIHPRERLEAKANKTIAATGSPV